MKSKLYYFKSRGKPHLESKYEKSNNHLSKEQQKKFLYNYYICDNCGCEIKVSRRNQSIIKLSSAVTHKFPVFVAICDKCLKDFIKQFD